MTHNKRAAINLLHMIGHSMKNIALSAFSLAALTTSALAADLPSRKEQVIAPPPPPMWTGFYVGINAGGTWANNPVNVVTWPTGYLNGFSAGGLNGNVLGASATLANAWLPGNSGSFIGGGQVGYNYQLSNYGNFANNAVIGIEADIQGVAGGNSNSSYGTAAGIPSNGCPSNCWMGNTISSYGNNLQYLGTVRGRLGYAVTPSLLVFGSGGFAYGGVSSNTNIWQIASYSDTKIPWAAGGSYSNTQVGWTAGGGAEWMFMPNWSAKVEYLYYDLGYINYNLSPLATTSTGSGWLTLASPSAQIHYNGNIARAGVNYHFNLGSMPVVAKF